MKTILTSALLALFVFSGCATWDGVKKDSNDAWDTTKDGSKKAWKATKEGASDAYDATKEAIHNATSSDDTAKAE